MSGDDAPEVDVRQAEADAWRAITWPQTAETFEALGRYVQDFSRLVFHMRRILREAIGLDRTTRLIATFVMSEAYAQQIANAFFGSCIAIGNVEDDEKTVATGLRTRVDAAIQLRNFVAHGDFWIGFNEQGEMQSALMERVRPLRKKGPYESKPFTPEMLGAESAQLGELRDLVAEFGEICLDVGIRGSHGIDEPLRVRDVFGIVGGEIVRNGPAASTKPRYG